MNYENICLQCKNYEMSLKNMNYENRKISVAINELWKNENVCLQTWIMNIFVCITWIMKIFCYKIHELWKIKCLFAMHELEDFFAIHELWKNENVFVRNAWIMKLFVCNTWIMKIFVEHKNYERVKILFAIQELWILFFAIHELWN